MANCIRSGIKTAGLIIIGSEILSGKVQDQNSYYLSTELRELGVSLMKISVVPDDLDMIGREARLFSEAFDYVFTSGGVGPTHDDITMAGIAGGFGVGLVRHPALEARFRDRYGEAVNEAILKMADIPAGSEVIEFSNNNFPLVMFRNIYIFPGIPQYLKKKFELIKENFRTSVFFLKKVYLKANEPDIAEVLNSVAETHNCVSFGSYPIMDNPEYQIILTAETKQEQDLIKAMEELLDRLPPETVVRVV